ncbi:MAG: tRNA glutamyl-Q(34) synthetase GluQRS [Alphaproteobacteria bacterium]|nr:tRNA glutamyl-Q(34) synthetase GluQRS [Alphaproteobacteria bacterium]
MPDATLKDAPAGSASSAPAPLVTRFAPSPTGHLHLGHAHSALAAFRAARAKGGRFLLRIEDIDPARCKPEYADAIEEDLAWLGLTWETPVRVQSRHLADYRAVLDRLAGRGLTYPCFCTRKDIAEAAAAPHWASRTGPDGPVYPGTCRALDAPARARRIAAGEGYALRLDMAAALGALARKRVPVLAFEEEGRGSIACDPARFGDIVLARKDVPASYHLCVTHDDALQGVSLVVRGADLFAATDIHRLLQALMGWPAPRYRHHPLLTDAAGRRYAKRDKALTLRSLREAGHSPAAVRALAGFPDP